MFRKKETILNRSYWVLLVGFLSGIQAWRFITRCVFLYHYFSALPFVMLAAILYLYEKEKEYPQVEIVRWIWLGIAAFTFILMYPAISGMPSSYGYAGLIEHILAFFGKVYYVGV